MHRRFTRFGPMPKKKNTHQKEKQEQPTRIRLNDNGDKKLTGGQIALIVLAVLLALWLLYALFKKKKSPYDEFSRGAAARAAMAGGVDLSSLSTMSTMPKINQVGKGAMLSFPSSFSTTS